MATIGRFRAVAEIGSAKFAGLIAWLLWLFIHIVYLSGFRNRLVVFTQWAWSFLTWQRSARLITGELGPEIAPPGAPLGSTPPGADQAQREAALAAASGRTAPADAADKGWMSADRDQAVSVPSA